MNSIEFVARYYLFFIAVFMVLLGVGILLRPRLYTTLAMHFKKPWGIWAAAGIRFTAAIALWFVAPLTCCPMLFKTLAILVLAAAFFVLLIGQQRLNRIIDWAARQSTAVLRLFALIALACAAVLLWALWGATTLV